MRTGHDIGMSDPKQDQETEQIEAPDAAPEQAEAEAAPVDEVVALRAALEAAQAEAAKFKDQMLRALAEAENTRRRAQRERDDAIKYAVAGFARDLLSVADNLRRAIASIPSDMLANDEALRNLASGVELTERLLLAAFERHNLRKIEPLGEKFDSNLHQAMLEVPNSGQPAGTVVQVHEAGYVLHDRLLRPALVGVAKAESPAKPAAGGSSGPNGASSPGGLVDQIA